MLKSLKLSFKRILDFFLLPFTTLMGIYFRKARLANFDGYALTRKVLLEIGVLPIADHYYEPQFKFKKPENLLKARKLPFDLQVDAQVAMLRSFNYSDELASFPTLRPSPSHTGYYFKNTFFEEGDADLYYLIIRNLKPGRIVEIGSGFSTLCAVEAIKKNKEQGHPCALTCIEPYENKWLDNIDSVKIVRTKVEELDIAVFEELGSGDILFIDSSHMIRPENDVLFEYFQILPALKSGVIIHIHDIFSPRHYLKEWLVDLNRLWDEQYLLEAFMSFNDSFEVMFSLNHLSHTNFDDLQKTLIRIKKPTQPKSFWIRKVK